ncbi:MAG: ureidoglycolate lyase [Alphaproteobacteria bacterium]|nr:ureidoglycolate lyase [Alphaproteobacteria bacterium]MBU0798733.1 ureidoglycolate lyase [Alphaproteobacteria bacterium]MBU0885996.1 ureidoglycolate lyase [Alphaproteobacteria bacterium]MBU1811985.1 ureidoglycolate lyase [Alphaproteobacteria bacterium]
MLIAQPLTAETFAPFGRVIAAPEKPGRAFLGSLIENRRDDAALDLSLTHTAASTLPFEARLMERHPVSSQAFLALDVARFLVIVAPTIEDKPDMSRARAFIGSAGQALVYAPATWHHGMVALDRPGRFAIIMWCAEDGRNDEFRTLAQPVMVAD